MGHWKSLGLIFLLLFCTCSRNPAPQAETSAMELVVLHTNDHHGHPLKFFNHPGPNAAGLAARATLVAGVKKAHQNVLVLDAGDINTGRPESNLFKGEPDILGYNAIGYDALSLGNHEFDNGLEVLLEQAGRARFPFLSANVYRKQGPWPVKPYTIKAMKGFRVAVLGLTTSELGKVAKKSVLDEVVVEDEVVAAKRWVPLLRKRADVVIVLCHMGIFEEENLGSKRLAREVPGIDLIVDGHTHTKLEAPLSVNGVPIVQAWNWGLEVGEGILTLRRDGRKSFVWRALPVNLPVRGKEGLTYLGTPILEDQNLLKLLEPYGKKADEMLSSPVGEAPETLFSQRSRQEETPLGNIAADSLLWYGRRYGAQLAILNGGSLRADLPAGSVTTRNIYEVLPFDNSGYLVTLKGSQLLELFRYAATVSSGAGAFPQVSEGVELLFHRGEKRLVEAKLAGEPIDPEKSYRVITNGFLASGGDGYVQFLMGTDRFDTSVFQRQILIEYISERGGKIEGKLQGRIRRVDMEPQAKAVGGE